MKVTPTRRKGENKSAIDKTTKEIVMLARRVAEAVMMSDGVKKKKVKLGRSFTKIEKNGRILRYPRYYVHIPSEFVDKLKLNKCEEVEIILDEKSGILIIRPIRKNPS